MRASKLEVPSRNLNVNPTIKRTSKSLSSKITPTTIKPKTTKTSKSMYVAQSNSKSNPAFEDTHNRGYRKC